MENRNLMNNTTSRDNQSKKKSGAEADRQPEHLCPVSGKCGRCQWIKMPYKEQLKQKEKWVRELLKPYCKMEAIIGMEEPAHYRHKVQAVFGEDRRHQIISGIYKEETHTIVPMDSCLIENQKADAIIVSIRELAKSFKIRPYNEDTGYGLLRHVLVRVGYATGEIMVVLVLASPVMPSKNNFVKALRKLHPEVSAIVVNVNPRGSGKVLGDREQVIFGKGYIEDVMYGKTFRIFPRSFYRVNPAQAEKLYKKALEYAGLSGKEVVLDAYCGSGTIGIIAASYAKQVIGVDIRGDAIRDARENARINGIKNIWFHHNDAGELMSEMGKQNEKADVIFMEPPGNGSSEAFLSAAARLCPSKVIYISCNPQTLVRDIISLQKKGYQAVRGAACDMLAFTKNAEICVELRRK